MISAITLAVCMVAESGAEDGGHSHDVRAETGLVPTQDLMMPGFWSSAAEDNAVVGANSSLQWVQERVRDITDRQAIIDTHMHCMHNQCTLYMHPISCSVFIMNAQNHALSQRFSRDPWLSPHTHRSTMMNAKWGNRRDSIHIGRAGRCADDKLLQCGDERLAHDRHRCRTRVGRNERVYHDEQGRRVSSMLGCV